MSHPDHLSVGEAAAIIGQSRATAKRLAKSGTLRAFLIGDGKGTWIFDRSGVEAYAAARHAELVEAIAKLEAAS